MVFPKADRRSIMSQAYFLEKDVGEKPSLFGIPQIMTVR